MQQTRSPSAAELPTPLEALLARAARTPEAAALVADGEAWSCARLASESARLADAFEARGVRPGDRIALHMFNLVELVLAYLACWRVGAIAAPLNTRFKPPELAAMLARLRPALYLGQTGLYEGIREVDADVLAPDARFVVDLEASEYGARPWTELVGSGVHRTVDRKPEAIDRDAPSVLLTTSGTAGPSKLVVWTSRTLAALAFHSNGHDLRTGDIPLIQMPATHAGGLGYIIHGLTYGALVVLLRRFEPDAALDAIEAHSCTTLFGTPFMFAEIVRRQRERPRDLTSLRLCAAAGDVCSDETARAFEALVGLPLLSRWGATECTGAMITGRRTGALSRPLPDTEVRLLNEASASSDGNEAGELLVRSPSTTPGYWLGPGRIEPLPDGWFHSGDLMRREPDGQLRYLGRNKDLILRGGSNVSPVEVEEALRRQPCVADAAVAGLPDPELGQRIGAVIVLADGQSPEAVPAILAGVRAELADYKVPEAVAVVDAIPRNALTKIDRRAVAALIARGVAHGADDRQ